MPYLTNEQLYNLILKKRLIQQDVSTGLLPSDVGGIFSEANRGFSRRQSKLCDEIIEKDWDLKQSIETRKAALTSAEWDIVPESPGGQGDADRVKEILHEIKGDTGQKLVDFEGFIKSTLDSLLPGFSVAEIYWTDGGTIKGFRPYPSHYFTHYYSQEPRLVIKQSESQEETMELKPAQRFVITNNYRLSGDPARGGLIRPIGWVYSFKNLIWKFLLRYQEKFGMPYVAAHIDTADEKVFEVEAEKVRDAIENMASDGGALFSGLTKLEFHEPNYSDGEVFFKTLSELKKAIDKLILGQTSTSDSENSNRSTAQIHNLIRHDILRSDCKIVSRTVNQQIIPLLCEFNGIANVPRMEFTHYINIEETKTLLETIKLAKDAGLEFDDLQELNRRTGLVFKEKDSSLEQNNNNNLLEDDDIDIDVDNEDNDD